MGCYSRKKKLPYINTYIRYILNCIFNMLFPIEFEEDEFTKGFKKRYK